MNNKKIYVTYMIKPTAYLLAQGFKVKRYAIACDSEEQAKEVASDVYSYDGISYLRINKTGRLHKDAVVLSVNDKRV